MKVAIDPILHSITKELMASNVDSLSLMEGVPGVIIYLERYVQHFASDYGTSAYDGHFDHLIENFQNPEFLKTISYCDGMAGILTFFEYWQEQVGEECYAPTEEIDEFLFHHLQEYLSNGYYDFLHKGLGILYYFIIRLQNGAPVNQQNLQRYLKRGLALLDSLSVQTMDTCFWSHSVDQAKLSPGTVVCNMGLAHGTPGILLILSYIHDLKIDEKKTSELISKTTKFLKDHRSTDERSASQFGSYVINDQPDTFNSRLAWCYGDLGISLALLKAGQSLRSEEIINFATDIAIRTCDRKAVSNTYIFDASFCHGSAGAAYMYGLWYDQFKIENFRVAQEFWLTKTIEYSRSSDGLAGFKTYVEGETWTKDAGMLKGIAGIGLVLLSYMTGEKRWDLFVLF